MGVRGIFRPGCPLRDIVDFVNRTVPSRIAAR
jgi:hypothetical protein